MAYGDKSNTIWPGRRQLTLLSVVVILPRDISEPDCSFMCPVMTVRSGWLLTRNDPFLHRNKDVSYHNIPNILSLELNGAPLYTRLRGDTKWYDWRWSTLVWGIMCLSTNPFYETIFIISRIPREKKFNLSGHSVDRDCEVHLKYIH